MLLHFSWISFLYQYLSLHLASSAPHFLHRARLEFSSSFPLILRKIRRQHPLHLVKIASGAGGPSARLGARTRCLMCEAASGWLAMSFS